MTKWLLYSGSAIALVFALLRLVDHIESIGYDRAEAEYTKAELVASESFRVKEKDLNASNLKVANAYIAHKKISAAAAVVSAGRLRDLQAAINSAASADASAAGRADDPRDSIIYQCGHALVGLDDYAKDVAGKAGALQEYARSVCVSK